MINRNCNDACRPGFVPGPPAPNYISGCALEQNPTLKTYVLPASLGTDAAGQPYAPRIGEFTNAIVIYEANNNIYIYDSLGTPTLIKKGDDGNGGPLPSIPAQQVQRDMEITPNASTIYIRKTTGDLYTASSLVTDMALPTANAVSAGVLSASDYNRFLATSNQVDTIVNEGGTGPEVVQTTGASNTAVMSQSAVTNALDQVNNTVTSVQSSITDLNTQLAVTQNSLNTVASRTDNLESRVAAVEQGGGGGEQPTVEVLQTTGQSTTSVMSQKAVTDLFGNVQSLIQTLDTGAGV